ncbi:MAG: helix-turn-helix transcriptional regulator [Myxococcales bacterium]|nr:helix-turn-helix transcriptional regulator [Myxococcales bacterium]
METLADRIQWVLKHRDVSATALSTKAGLAPGHVGHLLHGRVKNPQRDTLAAIAGAADVSMAWLVDGVGEPEPARPSTPETPTPSTELGSEGIPETLGAMRGYPDQERRARKQLARDGADVPEWVWPHVRASNPLSSANVPPSVSMLVELATLIANHADPSAKPPSR